MVDVDEFDFETRDKIEEVIADPERLGLSKNEQPNRTIWRTSRGNDSKKSEVVAKNN